MLADSHGHSKLTRTHEMFTLFTNYIKRFERKKLVFISTVPDSSGQSTVSWNVFPEQCREGRSPKIAFLHSVTSYCI